MRLEFHRQIASDISRMMDYCEEVVGPKLADEFYTELKTFFQVNLEKFPYHFLFRITRGRVRILVVRHHRRRPSLGLNRR